MIKRILFGNLWKRRGRSDVTRQSDSNAPTAPTGLAFSNVTSNSLTLTWSAGTPTTGTYQITTYKIYRNGVQIDSVNAPTLTYNATGLLANATYSFNVVASNVAGLSLFSNTVTPTTSSSSVLQDPAVGVNQDGPESNIYTDWPSVRVYRISHVVSAFDEQHPRMICVSDDANVAANAGASGATAVRNMLINFYEGSGSSARQNCEIQWCNRNELDVEYKTGTSLPSDVISTFQQMYNVIHEETSPGVRRFPKASMWVDMTAYQIKYGSGVTARFKTIAPYIDGIASSMYPFGFQSHPVVFTKYADYIDPIFALVADWKATYPNITMFGCWETGIPFDHSYINGSPNKPGSNDAAAPVPGTTNWSIRPRYFAGGRASGPTGVTSTQPNGSDYYGFLNYVYDKCVENQITCKALLYWNQDGTDAYGLKHDRIGVSTNPGPSPDTASAWRNWTPNSRLADL